MELTPKQFREIVGYGDILVEAMLRIPEEFRFSILLGGIVSSLKTQAGGDWEKAEALLLDAARKMHDAQLEWHGDPRTAFMRKIVNDRTEQIRKKER